MSLSTRAVMVITTLADDQAAKSLAAILLDRRLAACVQWYPIQSMYRWHDAIEHDREILVQAKTTATAVAALQQCIREHHPYETPEIIVVPIAGGSTDYLDWIRANVSETD